MSRKATFDVNLRGQLVVCKAVISPPDRDVGIMGEQLDDYSLSTQNGEELNWELTDVEIDKLYEAMPEPEDYESDYPQEADE